MARKKNAKHQMTSNKFAAVQKMEKDFLKTPGKLASHLNKTVKALKQKENKIKNAFSKIKAQVKNAQGRVKLAAKSKDSNIGKKKFNKAKKVYSKNLKVQVVINKQLAKISKSLDETANKQAKLVALRKHLAQFEKDWSKSSKKMRVKGKTKPKIKKHARVKTIPPLVEQRPQPNYELTDDRVKEEETTS